MLKMERSESVVIVDYGLGNLFSLRRAVQYLGFEARISEESEVIEAAPRVLIPGVGAFGDGMEGLKRLGLVKTLKKFADSGRPLLGICLGMQLFLSESEEFGLHEGLGLIEGRVVRFRNPEGESPAYKVPHVGWNALRPGPAASWSGGLFEGVDPGDSAYFVHSYFVRPERAADILAVTSYAGEDFCSVLQRGNVSGTQFHPEKSGEMGLKLLKNFLTLESTRLGGKA
jgi:glutamine amidotransferase